MTADIAIHLVTYNAADHLERCLATIDDGLGTLVGEIVVVDNHSTDGAPDTVRRVRPDAHLLLLGENIGFGRAMNRAARESSAPRILLLNPDTQVEPGAIERLVRFADAHPDAGVVGGLTVTADGQPDGMHCWGRPTPWSLTCFGLGLSAAFPRSRRFNPEAHGRWPTDRPYRVDAVTGAFLLVDRGVWDDLGGFDEDYFLYGEDVDLCTRAIARGCRPTVTPDARIRHVVGASSTDRPGRRVAVLRGKATYLRGHWRPAERQYGLAMLRCGVAIRALLGGGGWREVWHRRREWLAGYPARSAGAERPGSDAAGDGDATSGDGSRRSTGEGPSSDA